MQEIIQMIVDNGIGVACVGYLIYFQSTTMSKMLATLDTISNRLTAIETKIGEYHGDN